MKKKNVLLGIALLLALSACGGGGGDSSNGNNGGTDKPVMVWSDDPSDPNAAKWGETRWR